MMEEPQKSPPVPHTKRKGLRFPRLFLLSFIPFLVFSLGFIPVILTIRLVLYYTTFERFTHLVFLPFLIVFELLLLFVSELLISGGIIRMFRIRYQEGTYEYSVRDKNAFKWMLLCQLYTPMRKALEIIPMGGLQRTYLRLLGMKIGKNTLVGGVIKDPCLTEFGSDTTMGEYAILYAHIHNYEKHTITFTKTKVGNSCIIGAGAILMPGVTLQDHAVVAAGAVVPKNRVLEQEKIYAGNPATEITPVKKTN
ncbi:MAG: DapH/DapD/GlmU-related protein [Methanobacteriota archaeon]